MPAIRCHEFTEMAPDVALGLLSGDERAQALEHLAHCPTCRDHLEGLIRVADGLLLLAPLGEPAIGFETRVMDRLASQGAFARSAAPPQPSIMPVRPPAGSTDADQPAQPPAGRPDDPPNEQHAEPLAAGQPADPPNEQHAEPLATGTPAAAGRVRRRRTSRSAVVIAAVAAVVVVVAGIAGLLAGRAPGSHRTPPATQAVEVRADDNDGTCRLVAFAGQAGRPAELVIHLDESVQPPSSYSVVADPARGGPAVFLGTIEVRNGQGLLDANIPAGTGPVKGVRIIQSGRVHYQATFSAV